MATDPPRSDTLTRVDVFDCAKTFADGTQALKPTTLRVEAGEVLALLGPSGCGKTTTMRMIAGLEDVTEGEIWIGDRMVNTLEPKDRDISMVFQSYGLYPNLTVYERLKDDFENNAIFYQDPLLPEEWRADFQMQVVLQDEPGGSSSQGAVYLSNIHRLYQKRDGDAAGSNSILGPDVKKAQALDTGVALRQRIASHPTIMVLNDEAHHLHDPDLAWNQAIENLHDQSLGRGNRGLCLQLDFTATPKHDDGSLFRHIMCDFPLG